MGVNSARVDDSYKVFNMDCNVRPNLFLAIGFYSIVALQFPQYTSEWSIPYSNSRACLRELRNMFQLEHADRLGARVHFPVEIRFSASDDIWLSPSYGQKTTWIGIIQYKSVSLRPPQPVGFSLSFFCAGS